MMMTKTTTRTSVGYPHIQTRGRLRSWKRTLARDWGVMDKALHSKQLRADLHDFVLKKGVGRRRAFARLGPRLGPGVVLEALRLDGNSPLAIYSILKPRTPVAVDAEPESGFAQNCVTVNYVALGDFPGGPWGEGMWGLEIPDHALGRCMERSGMVPEAIIREAFHNALRVPHRLFHMITEQLYIKAGPGGFVCDFHCLPDISRGNAHEAYLTARTWLADGMDLAPEILVPVYGTGEPMIGDTILIPAPICRVKVTDLGDGRIKAVGEVWGEGMPKLRLASAEGSASAKKN